MLPSPQLSPGQARLPKHVGPGAFCAFIAAQARGERVLGTWPARATTPGAGTMAWPRPWGAGTLALLYSGIWAGCVGQSQAWGYKKMQESCLIWPLESRALRGAPVKSSPRSPAYVEPRRPSARGSAALVLAWY